MKFLALKKWGYYATNVNVRGEGAETQGYVLSSITVVVGLVYEQWGSQAASPNSGGMARISAIETPLCKCFF